MSKNWDLRKLHSVNIKRERVLPTINNSHLLNIHSIVSQEKVQREEVNITLQRLVIPHDVETQHMPVVLQELSKASIGMATSESLLAVFLVLLLVRRCDLHVF